MEVAAACRRSLARTTLPRLSRGAIIDAGFMRELPTGTITLLFADIERSTALLQELGRSDTARLSPSIGASCGRR
jgi:class 3 adenylate cyclase